MEDYIITVRNLERGMCMTFGGEQRVSGLGIEQKREREKETERKRLKLQLRFVIFGIYFPVDESGHYR